MRSCATCGQRFSGEAVFCPFDGTKLEGHGTQIAIAPPRDDLSPGSIIGGTYRIDSVLGEGGMGLVFAVTHVKLGKKFALKLLRRALARDPETRARFLQEAQAAGQIHHPNVVEITDFASLPDDSAYLVMEFLDGQPLSRMIKLGGAIPALRAVAIIHDIANALQAAHDAGIVHRDLKPDNVFIVRSSAKETAKILDFGVAKVAGSAKLTRTGMVFGTPHYMSPEQASGGAVDARTDVYALGVIMYEMFTGRVPFEADTYMGVLTKHMFEAPLPPSHVGTARELGALEDVTLKSLAKRPEDRYASMTDLVVDLERIVQVGPDGSWHVASHVSGIARPGVARSSARRPFPSNLADELEPPARAELSAAKVNSRRHRVRQMGAVLVGGVLLIATAIGARAMMTRSAPPTASTSPSTTRSPTEAPATPAPVSAGPGLPSNLSDRIDPPGPSGEARAISATSATLPPAMHPSSASVPRRKRKPSGGMGEAEDPWAKK